MVPNRIFICYSHKDEKWRDRLESQIKAIQIDGTLDIWDDQRIQVGEDWFSEIEQAINRSSAAILLISPHFLTSRFIHEEEIPLLLERHTRDRLKIFPLIISECPWKEVPWLTKIQARPRDGKQLAGREENVINSILADFAEELRKILSPEDKKRKNITDVADSKGLEKISFYRLPSTGKDLLGRGKELKILDEAWQDERIHMVILVGWGGIGKTAIVNDWLNRVGMDNFRGAERVFGWSFYSQGISEDRQVSADEFINEALQWFGDSDPIKGSPYDKGKRLASLIRLKKTILILDGMEPLQYPPGEMQGNLKDQALKALIKELCRFTNGLCIITTRMKVRESEHAEETTVKNLELRNLTPEVGARLLKTLGIKGTETELQKAAKEYDCHALALNLMGRYLAVVHEGDIRKRDLIPRLSTEEKEGGHARRIMESYESLFASKPELNILYLLGLFDRPAEPEAVEALRKAPAINGLTIEIQSLGHAQWKYALKHLRDLYLLSEERNQKSDALDCHPLIREHFAEKLRKNNPKAWIEGHRRLYDHYKSLPKKEYPDTLEEMHPLYQAVSHGCQAGLHQEALVHIYWTRIKRKDEHYSTKKLGAFGSDLAVLYHFFETPWRRPLSKFSDFWKAALLNWAGIRLRAMGRLLEAINPMNVGLEMRVEQNNWDNAAINSNNLSELMLILGRLKKAEAYGRQSVIYADRSEDAFIRMAFRTTLGDALIQLGKIKEAESLFYEAESIQKSLHPDRPFLDLIWGSRFCDLLLEQKKYNEAKERAIRNLRLAMNEGELLSLALYQIILSRSKMVESLIGRKNDLIGGNDFSDQAVANLRKAGALHMLPIALLNRSKSYRIQSNFSKAWEDLQEAREIAEMSGMKLYLADYHLEVARLCLAEGRKEKAWENAEVARKMIYETGYHRRDGEVRNLEEKLKK